MTDTSRYIVAARVGAAAGLAAAASVTGLLLRRLSAIPADSARGEMAAPAAMAAFSPPRISIGLNWNVFRGTGEVPAGGALSRRFRLAGTFSVSGTGADPVRRAVLDWLERERQEIVSEGDRLADVTVLRVAEDRVVLRAGTREETLWLSFSGSDRASESAAAGETPDAAADDLPAEAEAGRFGYAVGDNNWVFRREALMEYYNELMDDPVRLLQVFDSMQPLYDGDDRISGYMLDIAGEREFFEAVGLREGDVVRQVNAVPMTNRNRAERFIEHFARNNLNVFVLDVERGGEPVRMIYRIRE